MRIGHGVSRLGRSAAWLAAAVTIVAVGSNAEARPIRRSIMRAERRAARALAVPSRPEAPARTGIRPKQADGKPEAPKQAASQPAAKVPLPVAGGKPTAAKAPAAGESGVQRPAFEAAEPTEGERASRSPTAAEPSEDGTVSVLVRPDAAAAPADLQPLTFPDAAAKPTR